MRLATKSLIAATGALVLTASASAATIAFVGKANDTLSGDTLTMQANFRSTDVAKAYDIDGNEVYGTDGYKFWGTGNITQDNTTATKGALTQLPSYITSITPSGTNTNAVGGWYSVKGGGLGRMDDPTLAPGVGVANINSGVLFKKYNNLVAPYGQDLVNIVLASDATFRIGITQVSGDKQKGQQLILGGVAVDTLPEAAGGTVGGTGTAVNNYERFDIYLFNVTGVAGETLTLSGMNARSGAVGMDQLGISGITFDSVPEPASLGLLSFGALAMLRRRR